MTAPSLALRAGISSAPGRVIPGRAHRAGIVRPRGPASGRRSIRAIRYEEPPSSKPTPPPAKASPKTQAPPAGKAAKGKEPPAKKARQKPKPGDRDRETRPSPPPALLPEWPALAGIGASALIALVLGVFLLWRYDRLPLLPRNPGPLVRTWRRWRRVDANAIDDADQTALLRDIHAALARSAGETLYPATLPRLFERAPYLAPLRTRIESTFAASWHRFYGVGEIAGVPARDVLALLREAADRERRVPC